jgi:hypothetical protein
MAGRIRRRVKASGHVPNEQAALRCVYLEVMGLDPPVPAATLSDALETRTQSTLLTAGRDIAFETAFETAFDGRRAAASPFSPGYTDRWTDRAGAG